MIAFPSRVGSLSRCLRTSLHFQGVHPSRRQEQRNELSFVASEAATHSCLIHALISLHLNFYKRPTVVDCVMCLEASVWMVVVSYSAHGSPHICAPSQQLLPVLVRLPWAGTSFKIQSAVQF
ncbi:hypothetical protein L798_09067 [Zootermopsis nevadensis]|uniref:Uncharacterized protein n=1 Tax=Zootermopsis nevadensis TaxID=136037 RepID=A0A067QPE8_ZOONE|nr:hypothetical protein L798_09067 [Zootermopsis nevadensis]